MSLSSSAANRRPAKPGRLGKFSDPSSAVRVHVEDALLDVEATVADLVEGRRVDPVLLLRAAGDRVEPDVRDLDPLERPHVGAVVLADRACGAMSAYLAGRWRSNMSGGSTTWSSTLTMIMSSSCIGRAPGSCPGSPALSGALGRFPGSPPEATAGRRRPTRPRTGRTGAHGRRNSDHEVRNPRYGECDREESGVSGA